MQKQQPSQSAIAATTAQVQLVAGWPLKVLSRHPARPQRHHKPLLARTRLLEAFPPSAPENLRRLPELLYLRWRKSRDIEYEALELLEKKKKWQAAGTCFCSSASCGKVIFELEHDDDEDDVKKVRKVPGEMAFNILGPLSCLYGKALWALP